MDEELKKNIALLEECKLFCKLSNPSKVVIRLGEDFSDMGRIQITLLYDGVESLYEATHKKNNRRVEFYVDDGMYFSYPGEALQKEVARIFSDITDDIDFSGE